MLLGAGVSIVDVTPNTWKKYFRLNNEAEKSRALACQRFPDLPGLARKKDHNRAEALLIALWKPQKPTIPYDPLCRTKSPESTFALREKKVAWWDDTGTGKTGTAIALADTIEAKSTLVISPVIALEHWKAQFAKHGRVERSVALVRDHDARPCTEPTSLSCPSA